MYRGLGALNIPFLSSDTFKNQLPGYTLFGVLYGGYDDSGNQVWYVEGYRNSDYRAITVSVTAAGYVIPGITPVIVNAYMRKDSGGNWMQTMIPLTAAEIQAQQEAAHQLILAGAIAGGYVPVPERPTGYEGIPGPTRVIDATPAPTAPAPIQTPTEIPIAPSPVLPPIAGPGVVTPIFPLVPIAPVWRTDEPGFQLPQLLFLGLGAWVLYKLLK